MFSDKISDLRVYEIAILLAHELTPGLDYAQIQQIVRDNFGQLYSLKKIELGCTKLINLGLLTKGWPTSEEIFHLSLLGETVISKIKKAVHGKEHKLKVVYAHTHRVII